MLQQPKDGKIANEKRRMKRNNLNNNELQKLLKTCIFATNFAVGCFYASYERHFVKKIQYLSSSKTAYLQPYTHNFYGWVLWFKYRSSTKESCAKTIPKK